TLPFLLDCRSFFSLFSLPRRLEVRSSISFSSLPTRLDLRSSHPFLPQIDLWMLDHSTSLLLISYEEVDPSPPMKCFPPYPQK
uniref:Uncharacterized protein n=1 Tax=Ciona intestinalis TaxID=7719 RepID=F6R2S2_CIOIN